MTPDPAGQDSAPAPGSSSAASSSQKLEPACATQAESDRSFDMTVRRSGAPGRSAYGPWFRGSAGAAVCGSATTAPGRQRQPQGVGHIGHPGSCRGIGERFRD